MKLRPSSPSPSPSPAKKQFHLKKKPKGSTKGSSSTTSSSTSSSMEPPKGCLRFLLSSPSISRNKAPTFPSKLPSSTPKTRPLLAPPSGSPLRSASNGLEAEKTENGRGMTPPIEPSVSPEILCGSFIVSAATETAEDATTSPCYSAGHLLSGVSDNRKCRPRGLLVFEETPPLFDIDDDGKEDSSGDYIKLSSPIRASMRWLLSPCREEEGEDFFANSPDRVGRFQRLEEGTSPSDDYNNICCLSSDRCDLCSASSDFVRHKALPGPASFDYLVESPSVEDKMRSPNLDREKSPVSVGSLSSGNVMQTPQSESGSEKLIDMPWLNRNFDAELDALVGRLQSTTISRNSPVQLLDQASSSFQFDCLTEPSCSLDHSQFQKVLDDKALWCSGSSSIDTVPQTGVRISWREGLASRMFEMEEFDCCRCFSEDEEDCGDLNTVSSESDSIPKQTAGNSCSSDVLVTGADRDCGKQGNTEKRVSSEVLPSCCADSISTDGGGLARSDDSDWALCYKNHLFLD